MAQTAQSKSDVFRQDLIVAYKELQTIVYSDKNLLEAAKWLYSRKEVIERSMLIHALNAGRSDGWSKNI